MTVYILDKDPTAGNWVMHHLREIGIQACYMSSVADLLAESDHRAPLVCLVGLRPPVQQALSLVAELSQEPRFAQTSFLVMGPTQYKRSAFESGADDYIATPPEVIELRKRVRMYLDHAALEARVMAEVRITQEFEALSHEEKSSPDAGSDSSLTLLEHAAALTQERNLLEAVLRYAGEAIALVDMTGLVLYANPVWTRLVGHIGSQGMQLDWSAMFDNPMTIENIGAALRAGNEWRGEVRYRLPEGRWMDVEMSATPARDATGDIIGYVIVQHDVAERKAIEAIKTRFLADASVELRTPVTNIKMRQYLLRQAPPEQRAMHLQALERETERLSHLIDAMLELSRLDLGLVRISCESVDLNRILADATIRYAPVAEDKGVTLALTRNPSLGPVQADPIQLARAVGALIDNAILYTPEGGHIEVRLGHEAWTGGEFATIQIRDTGIGIEAREMPHIFERFYRSDRARDAGMRGVGLGLAIAQEIISRHNGDITVESQVNQGSLFTIWLPLKSCE